ncbi:MAG TPA: L-histidine N(alpha)-methyltransferase [Rhodospirillales bacterium]|nr:L-histidine N(alpha)-methyltransferase [Rhodospirillales bacterium]
MDTTVQVIDSPDRLKSFRDDVFEGLSREQKELPCKYFYDDRGSELFNTICGLDEYYPTRTETALLQAHGREMADLIGPGVCLIEFGCGSLLKTRLLLDALRSPAAFVPIDISADHLLQSAAALAADYPNLEVLPVVADFTRPVKLPDKARKASENRIGFFPGSTIGNFDHAGAADFLATVADMVGGGGALLIGVDLKKDEDILVRAYDDAQGVTAAFNRNVLERINRELGGCFDIETFRHRALYNGAEGRIEMHLVSEKDQTVTVHDRDFTFTEGETIHTEDSYKYHVEEFSSLAAGAGFRSARTWVDGDGLFSLHYLTLG